MFRPKTACRIPFHNVGFAQPQKNAMKKPIILVSMLFSSVLLFAQQASLSELSAIKENGNWITMLPESRVAANAFFDSFLSDLGLDENYHFELIKKTTDKLGMDHYRYREYFNGYPVEGATYILHGKEGMLTTANGRLVRGIPVSNQVSISAEEGLKIAKNHMGSEVFYWELPEKEALIKRIKHDPNATFYPDAELVYAQAQFAEEGEKYRLARKYVLYGADPEQKQTVFIDAQTGAVMFSIEGIHGGSTEGIAETRYHGTRTIVTDSVSATEFRLRDTSRGGGIETYNMNENEGDYSLAVDFTDGDNYWDNANAAMDDAATDAYWGAEMFYDYLLQAHGRDSYDGNGGIMISFVHFGQGYFNAFWNGLSANFGDGDNNPLTSIDVVAHEFTHGLTQYSADLVYMDEPGALNESFSDIFGTATEFFALGDEADWQIGTANFISRDLSDPNAFGDPDTYQGVHWYSLPSGDAGVHTNSGVQNFWFYLLSHGGSGVNDNGYAYSIDSLGMETAAAIAYRNLTVYLTPTSSYLDARYGAIQAAEDLYGLCSDIALEVRDAWYAVGVGTESFVPDFQAISILTPGSGCNLNEEEQVSMTFRLNSTGCDTVIEAGDQLQMSYQIDDQDPVNEVFVLTQTPGAASITYDFLTPADFSAPGHHVITGTVKDLSPSNNTTGDHEINIPIPFEGGDVLSFEVPASGDTLYKILGANASGIRSSLAANTGNYGYIMNSFDALSRQVILLPTEEGNFSTNTDFVSKFCVCVDLTGWDAAFLSFDLRQTFSPFYENELATDISYMIAARVTSNGQQIGDQFHPETNDSDPYQTHVMDLSAYAGTSFTLCFESVNYVNSTEDGYDIGDKAMWDHIYFSQSDPTGLDEILEQNLAVFPNPSTGMINIVPERGGAYDLRVLDLLGKTVKENRFIYSGNPHVLDLSNLDKGIYVITTQSEWGSGVQKVVVE